MHKATGAAPPGLTGLRKTRTNRHAGARSRRSMRIHSPSLPEGDAADAAREDAARRDMRREAERALKERNS